MAFLFFIIILFLTIIHPESKKFASLLTQPNDVHLAVIAYNCAELEVSNDLSDHDVHYDIQKHIRWLHTNVIACFSFWWLVWDGEIECLTRYDEKYVDDDYHKRPNEKDSFVLWV